MPAPADKATRDIATEVSWLQGRSVRGGHGLVKGSVDHNFDKRALFVYKRAPGELYSAVYGRIRLIKGDQMMPQLPS